MQVAKSALAVFLINGTEMKISRKEKTDAEEKAFNFRYELPFAFRSDLVSAEYNPNSTRLMVKLLKSVSNSSGVEVVVNKWEMQASATGDEKIKIDIKETRDSIILNCVPSKYNEDITLKLRDNKVVVWECKRTIPEPDGSKKIITATQSLKLPFEAGISAFRHVQQPGSQVQSTELQKPLAAGTPGEVQIPILDGPAA
jgi:hypothetical protein